MAHSELTLCLDTEKSSSSNPSEYIRDSPSRLQDNGSNMNRSSGPLLRRRAVDLSARTHAVPSIERRHVMNNKPAPSTTGGVDQPLRISREPVPESRFQSYQSKRQPGVVDARRAAAAPNGQRLLLRRSFQPRSASQSAPGQSSSFRGRSPLNASRGGRSDQPRRRRRESDFKKDDSDEDPLTWEERMYGPQPEPQSVPYEPKATTMEELRLDWPATAMDATGLAGGAQQKLEHLAKRIPHGYLTPQELAERFHKGEMVHFESEAERAEVLNIAAELAKSRADMLTERKGETIAPEDMGFTDVSAEEKRRLGARMVQGEYPALHTHKLPFLNHIAKNLRNNGTYHEMETSKFMEKIESLLSANRGGQQARKSV